MIFVNFKTYKEGTGINAIELVKVLEEVGALYQTKIIPVLQATDIKEAVSVSRLEIWTQHVDAVSFGAHTGEILSEAVYEDGAIGTFLNHSEHKFGKLTELQAANKRALEVGLKTLIFAANINELKVVTDLEPTYVAYEPPELVGSHTTSVAKAKPEVIKAAFEIAHAKKLPLVVGAGIKSQEDVRVSVRLGAIGVAVASDVVLSADPRKSIIDLIEGFN